MTVQDWDLRHFRLLDAIAIHGSISAACRSLGIAQPNGSRLLETMERSLGLPLAERSPAGTRLTQPGSVLAGLARDVLTAQNRFINASEAMVSGSGTLTVAASQTVAEHLMPAWLATARTQMPQTRVNLWVGNSDAVFERVGSGGVDLGFVEGPQVRTGFHYADIVRDDLVVIAAFTPELSARQDPSSGVRDSLIVREAGSGTRQVTDRALAALPGPVPTLIEVGSNAALTASVRAGLAPGVVSRRAVKDLLDTAQLLDVTPPGLNLARMLKAVWPTQHRLSAPAQQFLQLAAGNAA